MIYLDSCLVIYAIEPNGHATEAVLTAIGAADDTFAVSALVLMECLVAPFASGFQQSSRRTRASSGRSRPFH